MLGLRQVNIERFHFCDEPFCCVPTARELRWNVIDVYSDICSKMYLLYWSLKNFAAFHSFQGAVKLGEITRQILTQKISHFTKLVVNRWKIIPQLNLFNVYCCVGL